jgi:hypothetical protein
MADNFSVFDAHLNPVVFRTTDDSGIHIAHHKVRLIGPSSSEYKQTRPLPVAIQAINGNAINLNGSPTCSPAHSTHSIAVWGNTQVDGLGDATALTTSSDGHLIVDALTMPATYAINATKQAADTGSTALSIQAGAAPSSQVSGNQRYTPLITDSSGRLYVTFGLGTGAGTGDTQRAKAYMRLI